MNIVWNFIDETERHAELYNLFTPRELDVLHVLEDLQEVTHLLRTTDEIDSEEETPDIHALLRKWGVTRAEIGWLERTGRIPPEM